MSIFKWGVRDSNRQVLCSMKKSKIGRGRLTITVSLGGMKSYICSNCNERIPCPFDDWRKPKYCPECGANFDINGAATDAAEVVAKYSRLTVYEAYDFIARYLHELADKHAPVEIEEASKVPFVTGTTVATDSPEVRYVPERTCRFMPAGGEDDKPHFEQTGNCSECFGMMYGSDSYCPDCGAKVVE